MQLTIPAPVLERIRSELVKEDELERFAYLYCGRNGEDLLVSDVHPVDRDNLDVMAKGACRPELDVERNHIQECVTSGFVPVMVHSHPFTDNPGFSGVDVATMNDYYTWLHGLYPDTSFGFIVVGRSGIDASVWSVDEEKFQPLPVQVQGKWLLNRDWALPSERSDPGTEEDGINENRFDRNIRALGHSGQHQLADTHVAVVGCGGIGSILIEELARLGVKQFTLIDPDIIEESNLPRLVGAMPEHVNRPKVKILEQHLWHIAPDSEVTAVQSPVQDAQKYLENVDVIVAGVDKVSARMWLNEYSVRTLKPYIDAGVRIDTADDIGSEVTDMHGFIQTVVPGVTGCFTCLDRGDHEQARREQLSEEELEEQVERGYVDEGELAPEPAVIQLNGTIASMAVNEISKLVTGFDAPAGFLRYEGVGHDLVPMATSPSPECPTCGELLGNGPEQDEYDVVEDDPSTDMDLPV